MSDITVREGSREPMIFTLKRGGVVYDLGSKAVRMHRRDGRGNDDMFATTDTSPLLVATTPAGGVLTFTPGAGTWEGDAAGWQYFVYFEVEVSTGVWYAWAEHRNVEVTISPAFHS